MAAVAVDLCPARPQHRRAGQGGERPQGGFAFLSRFSATAGVLAKWLKYSTSARTRIRVSCTRLYLNRSGFMDDDGFTDSGVRPEVFTKGKLPIVVNWIFCLNKTLKIEPKG